MRAFLGLIFLLLSSCGSHEMLEVQQFHLRETDSGKVGEVDAMVRGEMNKRLYGAVTAAARENRLGQYYDVNWRQLSGELPVGVVFEYRQAATGSQILRVERNFDRAVTGATSFEVTGENYQKNGRVTAWQITLLEGGAEKASRRSYLWR